MPTAERLPQHLEDCLEEIRAVTAQLIEAASQHDSFLFLRSLTDRGAAIERFRAIVTRTRPRLTPRQVQSLDKATRTIAEQGDEAHAVLVAMMERAHRELEAFDEVAGTVRYGRTDDPNGFDRSR